MNKLIPKFHTKMKIKAVLLLKVSVSTGQEEIGISLKKMRE